MSETPPQGKRPRAGTYDFDADLLQANPPPPCSLGAAGGAPGGVLRICEDPDCGFENHEKNTPFCVACFLPFSKPWQKPSTTTTSDNWEEAPAPATVAPSAAGFSAGLGDMVGLAIGRAVSPGGTPDGVADEFTFDDLDDVAFRPLHESNCGPPLTHFDRPFERQSGPPAAAQSGTHSSGRKRTKLVAAAVGREGPRGNIDFERLWSEGEQRTSLKALAATHAAYNDKHWLRRLWCILHTDDPFVATMLPWSPCGTALGVNRSLPAALGGGKYLKASNMKSFQRQLTEYGFRTANDKPLDPAAASACSTWYSAPELSIHQTYEEFKEMCERRRRLNNLKKAAEPVPPKARGKP